MEFNFSLLRFCVFAGVLVFSSVLPQIAGAENNKNRNISTSARLIDRLVTDYMQRLETLEQLKRRHFEVQRARAYSSGQLGEVWDQSSYDRRRGRPSASSFGVVETPEYSVSALDDAQRMRPEWRRRDHPDETTEHWVAEGLLNPTLEQEQREFVQEFLEKVRSAGFVVELDPNTLRVKRIRQAANR